MSGQDRLSIKRIYNNNVLLAAEATGAEVVLLGKGIGFGRRAGEEIESSLAEQRFVAQDQYRLGQLADVLSDAVPEQIAVAQEITELGIRTLGLRARHALMIPVLDHLVFAVRRAQAGDRLDFPLRWEVAQLYPAEAALGRQALALIAERLGVQLQEEEWVAFALHFVNQQWDRADVSRTVLMTETIARMLERLGQRWGVVIDENSTSTARFITHVRYVFARAASDQELKAPTLDVLGSVRQAHPEAAESAEDIAVLIGQALGRELGREEVSYLALHTMRLFAETGQARAERG